MDSLTSTASLIPLGTVPGAASVDSLFNKYRSRLFRLAYRITGNHEDAEDAVQETLYRVATKAHQFRGQSQFSTWLTSIAINQAFTCLRQRKRDRSISLDQYLLNDDDRPQHEVRDSRLVPEAVLLKEESWQLLERCIARLPNKYQTIIELRYFKDLSTSEIRAELGLTEPAAKSRLVRARRMLRHQLEAAG